MDCRIYYVLDDATAAPSIEYIEYNDVAVIINSKN